MWIKNTFFIHALLLFVHALLTVSQSSLTRLDLTGRAWISLNTFHNHVPSGSLLTSSWFSDCDSDCFEFLHEHIIFRLTENSGNFYFVLKRKCCDQKLADKKAKVQTRKLHLEKKWGQLFCTYFLKCHPRASGKNGKILSTLATFQKVREKNRLYFFKEIFFLTNFSLKFENPTRSLSI